MTDAAARRIANLALDWERTRCEWTPGTSSGWNEHVEATKRLTEACRKELKRS